MADILRNTLDWDLAGAEEAMRPEFHHILYPRPLWKSQKPASDLRNNKWLIAPLDHEVHNALHRNIGMVPVLNYVTINAIARDYAPYPGEYIRSLEELIRIHERVIRRPHTPYIEKGVGELACFALKEQIEYLREGLMDGSA